MSYTQKNIMVLDELKNVDEKNRTARFIAVISYISNDCEMTFRGECEGKIGFEARGENGFGYDPIFYVGEKSFAEIKDDEKNKISHRALALKKLIEYLKGEI